MKAEIDAAVRNLAKEDLSNLYAKLGAYSIAFPQDPALFAAPAATIQVDVRVAGPLDEAIALGKRILRRWQKAIFDLVCSTDGVDPQARTTILDALKLNSPEALSAAITSVLIAVFSVGPAVAAIVGVLFGKILLPTAGAEVCSFWKGKL
jgi:hypothetical protein